MQEYIEFIQAHPVLSLAWVLLFIAVIITSVKAGFSKIKNISTQQVTMLINRDNAKIIDVRSKEEFKKGHIVNAINVPMAEIKNNQVTQLENYKLSPIVLVCNAGVTSSQAGHLLEKQGFEKLFSLKGGMGDWLAANLPIQKSKR